MAADEQSRPKWLDEQCPSSCDRIHEESDHPEDRFHQAEPTVLPSIVRRSLLPEDRPEACELLVMPVALTDRPRPWIVLHESEGRSGLILDRATAQRLQDALGAATAQLAGISDLP
jgi:hypothetical protein